MSNSIKNKLKNIKNKSKNSNNQKRNKKQEFYAFWKYDLYPYLLVHKIIEFCNDGLVKVEGYGGYRIKPAYIGFGAQGKKLLENIKELSKNRDDAELEFKKIWNKKLLDIPNVPVGILPSDVQKVKRK